MWYNQYTYCQLDLLLINKSKEKYPYIEYDDISIQITNDMYTPYLKLFSAMLAEKNTH